MDRVAAHLVVGVPHVHGGALGEEDDAVVVVVDAHGEEDDDASENGEEEDAVVLDAAAEDDDDIIVVVEPPVQQAPPAAAQRASRRAVAAARPASFFFTVRCSLPRAAPIFLSSSLPHPPPPASPSVPSPSAESSRQRLSPAVNSSADGSPARRSSSHPVSSPRSHRRRPAMATLSAGVLLKLLDGMKTGAAKPVGEHRTAVLQVTDIVPAEMDEVDLFPKHGRFYVKVSDSSHSIYATLPPAQADLVLANKLSLGQFLHVDRLDPGSPVPVVVGARPIPGRHPLVVGTPEPLARKPAAPRRGSWGPENHGGATVASPKVVRPIALCFEERTPVKERPSPARSSVSSVRKSTSVMPRLVTRSRSFVADRGDPPPPPNKIPKSPLAPEKSSMSCTAVRTMSRRPREEEPSSPVSDDDAGSTATSSKRRPSSSAARVPVPVKLSSLGKEAMEQREQAQKAALEALRNASATDNVVRIYKMFADVSKAARPDAPAACFDGFLSFHQEAAQAVADIESIQAATSMAAAATSDVLAEATPAPNVLQEIAQNRATTPARRRGLLGFGGVSKSVSFAPGTLQDPSSRQDGGGARSSSASRKCLGTPVDGGDDKSKRSSAPAGVAVVAVAQSPLGSSLRMARQMQAEAGGWFMEFLEAALEAGLKKKRTSSSGKPGATGAQSCPQSLVLRVINWVEMEQSGGESRKAGHPRAAAIARKLRIKAKNP
ncbi:hypothetical protein VPH35_048520 [Triticum aestivum]